MINLDTIDAYQVASEFTTLKRTSTTEGGNFAGQCPVCGDRDDFYVVPEHIGMDGRRRGQCACRECHPKRMDAIGLIMWAKNMEYRQALEYLHDQYGLELPVFTGTVKKPVKPAQPQYRIKPLPMNATAPSLTWQARARQAITRAQDLLWHETVGKPAREYLYSRGLTDETILAEGLGFIAEDTYDDPLKWALNPEDVEKVYIPRGIIFPYIYKGEIWKLRVRRFGDDIPKEKRYMMISGSSNGLYRADCIRAGAPLALYEGEIDALTGAQETANEIVCVATGSTSHARLTKWAMLMARASHVLRCFDPDTAGSDADRYWAERFKDNSSPLAPLAGYHDTNEMLTKGAAVGAWLIEALPIAIVIPSMIPAVIPSDTNDTYTPGTAQEDQELAARIAAFISRPCASCGGYGWAWYPGEDRLICPCYFDKLERNKQPRPPMPADVSQDRGLPSQCSRCKQPATCYTSNLAYCHKCWVALGHDKWYMHPAQPVTVVQSPLELSAA